MARHVRVREGPLLFPLLLDGIVLFLALSGTVFSFLTAFSLEALPLPVLAGCAASVFPAVAVWSLPRRRWIPLLLIGAAWTGALWRLWELLVQGEISLRCSVVNAFVTSLGVGELIGPIAQLPDDVWRASCTALLLMALIPLALLLGLSVVRLRSFGLTALITLPFLAVPLSITVTPAWLPLMAVLASWGTLLLASLVPRDGAAYHRLRLAGLLVSALTLTLLTLLFPQEGYRRPAWAEEANGKLVSWAVKLSDRYFPDVNLTGGGLLPADQEVDLTTAGPLRFSGRTVLDVRTSLRGRIYLRGFSSALYDGTGWHPLDEQACWRQSGQDASMPGGLEPMNFPALAAQTAGQAYAPVTIRNTGATPGYVYVPYHILTTPEELSGAEFVHDAYLAAEDGVESHTVYVQPDSSPLSGAELPEGARQAELLQYGPFVRANYFRVPAGLQSRLTDLLAGLISHPEEYLPGGADNEHYRALLNRQDSAGMTEAEAYLHIAGLVTDYLAAVAQYDPDTPATPEGEDFVDYFLTVSHRGYCMHFASAATLMLRTLGVPARYVSGYVADVSASGRALVPDSNAHAWVEVYLSGYGWYPVEVTPIYAGSDPGVSGTVAAAATPAPTTRPVSSQTPRPTPAAPTPTPAQAAQELPSVPGWLWAAAVLLLLPVLWRRLARFVRRRRFSGPNPNRAAIEAYRYLQRLARRGGRIPPEALALAQKAKFSQHTLTEDERSAAVDAAQAEAKRLDGTLPLGRRILLRYLWGLY